MTDTADTETPDDKGGAVKEFIEIVKTVAYALGIALVLRVLLFQPFTIPSASMEPNLYQGDYIIVSKFSYGWSKHSIPFSPPLFNGRILGTRPRAATSSSSSCRATRTSTTSSA
jgi:signal peptidase I